MRLEVGDDLGGATRLDQEIEPLLDRAQSQLAEPLDFDPTIVHVDQIAERFASPQPQRIVQLAQGDFDSFPPVRSRLAAPLRSKR